MNDDLLQTASPVAPPLVTTESHTCSTWLQDTNNVEQASTELENQSALLSDHLWLANSRQSLNLHVDSLAMCTLHEP